MRLTTQSEWEDEFELEPIFLRPYGEETLYHSELEVPDWPQWPTSRSLNPPAGSVSSGPYQTSSTCGAVEDDFQRLTLAVGELKDLLRRTPPDPRAVSNRADVVTALARRIVKQLQDRWYVRQGCTQQDMSRFASLINTMRGRGGDADAGSWPVAKSASVQGPRKQARESLRHLLNWIRRAEREFPRI
jgi:hypothetical protein